jgi:hypothetical protein
MHVYTYICKTPQAALLGASITSFVDERIKPAGPAAGGVGMSARARARARALSLSLSSSQLRLGVGGHHSFGQTHFRQL